MVTLRALIAALFMAVMPAFTPAQEPDSSGNISVIITLADKVNPNTFTDKDEPKGWRQKHKCR